MRIRKRKRSGKHPRRAPAPGPDSTVPVIHLLSLGLLVTIILTGGGISLLSRVVALVGVGALLIWKPPGKVSNPWILAGGFGLFLWGVLSLIIPRFGGVGPSLSPLVETYGLSLPDTLSAQPFATVESLVILVCGFSWLCLLLNNPLDYTQRKDVTRVTLMVLAVLSLGILWGNTADWKWPFAREATVFTFIANRNQMGNILMIGGFLSVVATLDSFRRKGDWSIIGVVLSLVLILGLFQLQSRAVVVLLFLGVVLWLIRKALQGGKAQFVKVGIPITLILFSIFLFFGETSRDRILRQFSGDGEIPYEFRLLLYRDAFSMFLERPLAGFGMGNFEAIFPQFRNASFQAERVIHPDSDFFWILTETGLVGFVLVSCLVFGLFQCLRVGRGRKKDPIQFMVSMALMLFLIHSLVDVSAHRIGSLFFMLFLVAVAQQRRRRTDADRAAGTHSVIRRTWQGVGALLALVGLLWGAGMIWKLPLTGDLQQSYLQSQLEEAVSREDPDLFFHAADGFARAYPLNWNVYFTRGSGTLLLREEPGRAAADFRVARFLNPSSPRMTFLEGVAWLSVNPQWTLDAWRETLNRPRDSSTDHRRKMLAYFKEEPSLREGLLSLSESDPELRYLLLEAMRGAAFVDELQKDIAYDPDLSFYSPRQREGLLRKWALAGGGEFLLNHLEGNPDMVDEPWRLQAVGLANTGRHYEAIRILRRELDKPMIPVIDNESISTFILEREFQSQPEDILKGATLLKRLIGERRWPQALTTARTMSRNPNVPPYVFYWLGEIYFMQDDLEKSWAAFEEYVRRS